MIVQFVVVVFDSHQLVSQSGIKVIECSTNPGQLFEMIGDTSLVVCACYVRECEASQRGSGGDANQDSEL